MRFWPPKILILPNTPLKAIMFQATLLGTFDLVIGVQRYFVVGKNYLTAGALFPGNTYYFAVTAYNYNEDPQLIEAKALESPLTVFSVTTQAPPPGVRYESEVASELTG